MIESEERWLTMDEVCACMYVTSDTVNRWIEKYAMPAHRFGDLWKFKKSEIDRWVCRNIDVD